MCVCVSSACNRSFRVEHMVGEIVWTIAASDLTIANHALRGGLQIIGLTNVGGEIDENGGHIEHPAKFTGGIVPGEGVMVVVKAFADSAQNGGQTFGRMNVLVVWMRAPQMRSRIHQPGHVQCETVAEDSAGVEGQIG